MPSITLHAATETVRELLDRIDPETGELPAEYEQAKAIVAAKATAVAAYVLEVEKQAAMAEDYAKELMARVKTARRRGEWLRQYLAAHMKACGITRIEDERGIFKAVLSPDAIEAVEVFDVAQLPPDYMREIPAKHEPDKILIRSAIKDGFTVPGAKLVTRDKLVIK